MSIKLNYLLFLVVALQMQHQQLQQQYQQQQNLLEQATPHPAIDSVFAESEQMRKDLHVLQQKISNLNINKPPVMTKVKLEILVRVNCS